MPAMSLMLPPKLKQEMDSFPEINWSEVARQAFQQKIEDMRLFKEITSKSKLTETDAIKLGKKAKYNVSLKYFPKK